MTLVLVLDAACLPDLGAPAPFSDPDVPPDTHDGTDLQTDGRDTADADTALAQDTSAIDTAVDTAEPPLSYVGFAGPFISAYCTHCHQAQPRYGAPMSLETYELVILKLDRIRERAVQLKEMPPLPPLPGDADRERLGQWIDEGAIYE